MQSADGGAGATLFALDIRTLEGRSPELVVRGDLDMVTAPELESRTDELGSPKELVIDLSGVTFMDSTGLRALWTLRQNVATRGGRVLLRSPSSPVTRVLATTKLDKVFEYVDGEAV